MTANTTTALTAPPLCDGDRLTADEFHRRYSAMPGVSGVNLVNGVVHMASPIRAARHGGPHGLVMTWLGCYTLRVPGVELHGNETLRVDHDNEIEPDAVLALDAAAGGRSWIDGDDYRRGAPELLVEIAASSARLDAGEKWELYQRIGVQEYVLWRVEDEEIDWWGLAAGSYERLTEDAAGVIRSRVFPGLWLDPAAMIARDRDRVAEVVDLGKASPEHAAFVEHLRRALNAGA